MTLIADLLALVGGNAYFVAMARTVLSVVGILLAIWLVVSFLIPALLATVKVVLIIALIALAVVAAITLVGRMSR